MTPTISIDPSWSIFLDRDGTINKRIVGDYVRDWDQFEFLEGAVEGIASFSSLFAHCIIVTNQQGIGKGLMSHEKLEDIHGQMMERIEANGGRIDQVYYCPNLASEMPLCRKPEPGMAIQAGIDFPAIVFHKSIMVGDTESDMEFGRRLNMKTVLVLDGSNAHIQADLKVHKLTDLLQYLIIEE